MKTSKPMKRTPMRSKRPEWAATPKAERPRAEVKPLERAPNYARGEMAAPIPKHEYVRSPALMRAYRLIPCQHCGKDDGTVCGAHSNLGEHGKGRGIKADDNRCASLCSTCHHELDQGSILSAAERAAMWWCAHAKTVRLLVFWKHWPANVPVPNLEWTQ